MLSTRESRWPAFRWLPAAGPSLVIIPRNRKDESGPDNEGYVIDLPSGKMTLRIAPFFNINAAQLEKEAKYHAENAAFYAKLEADRKAAKQKEATDAIAQKNADCESIINEAKMKQGTALPIGALVYKRGSGSCRSDYAIWGFDCDTRHFTATGINDNYDADASRMDYSLCENGPYAICSKCGGHPSSTSSKYIKDDAWHQTNFNVYKSDLNAVKKIQVTTTCKRCAGEGIVKK